MEKVAAWLTSGGWDSIVVILTLLSQIFATIATKMMRGPRQATAITWSDKFKAVIRFIGGCQFKDEPGKWSVPLVQKDSKLRIVDGKTTSLIPPKQDAA